MISFNLNLLKISLLALFFPLFLKCDEGDDDINSQDTVDELGPLSANFEILYPNGNNNGEFGSFSEAVWNTSGIRISGSDSPSASWVEFRDIVITGTGQYQLLYAPYARANLGLTYSTNVDPVFWINQGSNVTQGGVLNITSYSSSGISGTYEFIGWGFSETLNREVGMGIRGTFENIPFQN